MLKYYVVLERSGEYEDYYEHIVGVCPTLSLAKSLKNKIEDLLFYKGNIPDISNLVDEFWKVYYFEDIDEAEGIHKLHPEYSLEDIELALEYYHSIDNEKEIIIREINFYENENDLNNVTEEY